MSRGKEMKIFKKLDDIVGNIALLFFLILYTPIAYVYYFFTKKKPRV